QGKRSDSGQARSLFIPPRNKFRTTSIAKAAAAGKMVRYELPHFQLPAKGVSPNFWRNLDFRRRNSFSLWQLQQKIGSAKGLAEPPFWRDLGGTSSRRVFSRKKETTMLLSQSAAWTRSQ